MKRTVRPHPAKRLPISQPDPLTEKSLLATYEQNWLHVRHVETERMLSLNAFVAILVAVIYALSRPEGTFFAPYAMAVLLLFSTLNLIISVKIEAVIQDYVARNSLITTKLGTTKLAGSRVRKGIWGTIKLGWLFPAFYAIIAFALALYVSVWDLRLLACWLF